MNYPTLNPTVGFPSNFIFKFARTNRLYSDQIEQNLALKLQIKEQSKEIEELKVQTDIPPQRPKHEILVVGPIVDLTIDSAEEENEALKKKINEIEGRDSRLLEQ